MATDFGTGLASGLATNVTNAILGLLCQHLNGVRELGKNLQLLNNELARMDESLRHIQIQFEDQQKKRPELVEGSLGRISNALEEVKSLILCANKQRGRCRGCCLFFNPKIPADIREWKTRFSELFQHLDSALSTAAHTAQIVVSAQPQAEVLLQPIPDSGFVGSGLHAAQQQLLTWLNEPHPQARVIGVWGMAGVGKTALLQLIYNNFKKKVSTSFDFVIWYTISQSYKIASLQDTIAESLKLEFEPRSSIDMRKMKLYASLENKRFLLFLDDMWSPIDLNQVGVNFGHDNGSKVLISSRYRDVVEIMAEKEYCMMLQPLSTDEGWELFRRRAFRSGAAPDNSLEVIARKVASECKGLPLAINTVAAAMARKRTADEWSRSLVLMKNADPSFPSTHRTIDAELYQRIRWSYNNLPNNLKMCFLYCAAFPEDAEIDVETLVEMWSVERLVPQKGTTYFMDVGREYVEALVDRCLIEYHGSVKKEIKVHDVLHDMAIYVGQGEENWLFEAGQHLQHFPSEEETKDRKRISVLRNEISDLPTDLKGSTLVSLMLAENTQVKDIPEGFLVNFMSLKILDLSYTSIQTLPTAVGQLGQLEFLKLKMCVRLKDLPDSICNLSHLQFLNLEDCESLFSLPCRIGELKNLKHLKFTAYKCLRVIPHQISQLISLNKLVLPRESTPMSVEDLTNLSNLIELDVRVNPEIKEGSMSTWSKMRNLRLWFPWGKVENRDDAGLDILPQNMQSMEELQSLELFDYEGVSLPNCICQFQNLKNLCLSHCKKLEELPALEIGSEAASDGFPKLEELRLDGLNSLESIVWNANTMLQLQILSISYCRVLKTFTMEELPNLRELHISGCAQLKKLFMDSGGGFPKLKTLYLESLDSLESVVRNAKTMLHVQRLTIWGCRVLKTLRMEELPNLRELNIWGCAELKELFMESGGRFPELQTLDLSYLDSLESIVCNAETMLQLQSLTISGCGVLKALRIEELPNLKDICIKECPQLEVEIGSLPVLQKLSLTGLEKAESIAIPSSAWNQETMPSLEVIEITGCPLLRRMPREMEKLPKLKEIVGKLDWWDGISWENDNVKSKLSHLLKGSDVEECDEGSALEEDGDEGSELKEDGEVDEDTELGKDGEVEECEGNGEDDHPK